MKQTLSTSQATDLLIADDYNGWGYDEAKLVVDGLEQLEEDCGTGIDFNVVDIRCEYDCEAWDDVLGTYDIDIDNDEEHTFGTVLEYLQENTLVINYDELSGYIAYASF